ncbi:MAG: hypothetical protein K1X28_06390 [Parachlamydiales bacterium]|nr:hypothetical protein [Parachlamydiales bacterium]
MAAGFQIIRSGNFALAISDSWIQGMDCVQKKIDVIQAFLKKEEANSPERLEQIQRIAQKQLRIMNVNLPHMKDLEAVVLQSEDANLAAQLKPYMDRAANLKRTLEAELTAIAARICQG